MQKMYGVPIEKAKYLPLGGSLPLPFRSEGFRDFEYRRELNIPDDCAVIVSGGKLDENKRTLELIEAFKLIDNSKIFLVIFGNSEPSYGKKLRTAAQGLSNIHILGWLDLTQTQKLFCASDIACFPGTQSALWQQAICCELPLAVRYWKGGEYLNRDRYVHFIESGSVSDISAALREIFQTKNYLLQMKESVKAHGAPFFSYENIGKKVIEDYLEIRMS